MILSHDQITELYELAQTAAFAAGKMIRAVDRSTLNVNHKASGQSLASQVVTAVDMQSEAIILSHLQPSCEKYDLAWLAEESAHHKHADDRLNKDYFWCIDPLDGTLPFIEFSDKTQQGGYAVCIALVAQSGKPVLGVVYDIYNHTLYSNCQGKSLCKHQSFWPSTQQSLNTLHLFFDRSFLSDPYYDRVMNALMVIQRELGLLTIQIHSQFGAAINACSVLEYAKTGARAAYFKLPKQSYGGGSVWDFAATAALFDQTEAVATNMYGNALDLNRNDSTFMNHQGALFASDKILANKLRQLYRVVSETLL